MTVSAPPKEARIRAADEENRARLGSPSDRSSSAMGWSPRTREAPPTRPVVPSDDVVHRVRRRTPSANE